jgi:hypothetical protein
MMQQEASGVEEMQCQSATAKVTTVEIEFCA